MAHWEVTIPYVTHDGSEAVHLFAVPIERCTQPTAAVDAAREAFCSARSVRHRRGVRARPRTCTSVLRDNAV